jgi:hypothetical protein
MLGTIEILFKNTNDNLFQQVCEHLGMNNNNSVEASPKAIWNNEDSTHPIRKVNCYSISYNVGKQGRIWWTVLTVDLRLLYKTKNNDPVAANQIFDMEDRIDALFQEFFGFDVRSYLPDLVGNDLLNKRISYLEYIVYIHDVEADSLMKRLDRAYFDEKQLDPQYFNRFWIRNATPAFTINKIDDSTVRLCIKCKETAIKSMYKKDAEPNVSIANDILFNRNNVIDAFCKQVKKYTKPLKFDELSREAIAKNL